jgi:acetyl-CoA acyltransferase
MQEAFIVAATRSAVGRAIKGTLATSRPDEMAGEVVRGLMARVPSVTGAEVDDIILGCAFPEGEQGMNMTRQVVFLAGLPDSVSAMTINRFCSSGLEAVHLASIKIATGNASCIVAGGSESMSLIPMGGAKFAPSLNLAVERPGIYLNMGLTAERVAEQENISREDQDRFALTSNQRACAALDQGLFKDEITPLKVETVKPAGKGTKLQRQEIIFDQDEGPRCDTDLESLAKLRPAFKTGGTVTAGNTSQMSDGAAALMVVSEEFARERELKPLAKLIAYATAGLEPELMGLGPIHAVPKVMRMAGLQLGDIDLIELNEAFAAQGLAVMRKLGLDPERTNVNGGAIALGHPLGCTGAKLSTQAIYELRRRGGGKALVTMCVGGGMGAAGIFEVFGV